MKSRRSFIYLLSQLPLLSICHLSTHHCGADNLSNSLARSTLKTGFSAYFNFNVSTKQHYLILTHSPTTLHYSTLHYTSPAMREVGIVQALIAADTRYKSRCRMRNPCGEGGE
jgi:hypothetical protein